MEHADIQRLVFIESEGMCLAFDSEGLHESRFMFSRASVAPDVFELLQAAPMLYQQLTRHYEALQVLINQCDAIGATGIVGTFIELQNAIMLTQQCAREGIEKVGKQLEQQPKLG